jgi:hypothetical protein
MQGAPYESAGFGHCVKLLSGLVKKVGFPAMRMERNRLILICLVPEYVKDASNGENKIVFSLEEAGKPDH